MKMNVKIPGQYIIDIKVEIMKDGSDFQGKDYLRKS